jgi:predicted nucleic acid-binding protein
VIVVDTNVLAYAMIEGPRSEAARRVLTDNPDWRVPELWRHEFLNILVNYVRAGMDLAQAVSTWNQVNEIARDSMLPVDLRKALRIAVQYQLSGYDAQFIALAQMLGVSCVTADRKLAAKVPQIVRWLGES